MIKLLEPLLSPTGIRLPLCVLLLAASACSSNSLLQSGFQHGREQESVRPILPLSGVWKFKPGIAPSGQLMSAPGDDHGWAEINVPANWFLEGHDISGVAWYKKHFAIPDEFKNKRVSLKFHGVDYIAEVWLNGRKIGRHEGYFQPFSFDVTDAVRFGKDNILAVKVDSPLEKQGPDWSLNKRLIKGIFGHHDSRPGGAWSDRAQEKNTGGIWAPVELEFHDVALVDQIQVTPELDLERQSATAHVNFQIELKQEAQKKVALRLALNPDNFPAREGAFRRVEWTLRPGINTVKIPLSIEHPELWWPWDQGKPNLYNLQITVLDHDKVIDAKSTRFGFRQVRYDGKAKHWRINGKRMFLRGTNYIATQWLSEMNAERFGYDIALMKNANMNAVRIHAHVTSEAFYRLCDEAGLLIWQDFPLQWGYTDDKAFEEEAVRQAREMVAIFYNHPSIIAWSLINEPAWEADWMKYNYPSYTKDHNKRLTDRLFEAIEPLDQSRHVHAYSATAEHPWLGWYAGSWLDFNKPAAVPIVAEFGAQALPHLPSLRKIMDEADLWPVTEEQWQKWEYHNFQRKETFENAKIAKGRTPAEFVHNTQTYQAKLIRLAAESYRRQRYQPVNSLFHFMLVEDWPSMNWGIVDYWRIPKSGYYALQQAYQPVLPSIAWEKETFKTGETAVFNLWVINDLLKPFPGARLSYSLRSADELKETQTIRLDIDADSGRQVKTLEWKNLPVGHYEIVARVQDGNGNSLGINTHEFDITP